MKRLYIPLLLLLLVIFEGVVLDFIPFKTSQTLITPHLVLMLLILIAIYYDKESTVSTILYALIFGLIIDIVYTDVLGVYMFSYGLIVYIARRLKTWMNTSFIGTLFIGFLSMFFVENLIYLIYSVIDYTSIGWLDFIIVRFLPTLLTNLLFLAIMYPLMADRLLSWAEETSSNSTFL